MRENAIVIPVITVTDAVAGATVVGSPTPMTNGVEDFSLSAADTLVIRVCNAAGFGSTDVGAQTRRVAGWRH